jgi:uncharacterized protein (TIGR02145 family)
MASILTYNGKYVTKSDQYVVSNVTTAVDVDGNVYTSVVIGTQVWMVENLKTTKYKNGTSIPNLTVSASWMADTTGAYCWYNNNISYKTPYGALYNWYAINNAAGLAPEGWHIPTLAEWTTLQTYLGGSSVAGQLMKEVGNTHWQSSGGTNTSGFTGVGAGERYGNSGNFGNMLTVGDYAPAEQYDATYNYLAELYEADNSFSISYTINANHLKSTGNSVRCIKN